MGSMELPPDVLAEYMAWNALQQDKAKRFQALFVGLLGAAMLVNLLSYLDHDLDIKRAKRAAKTAESASFGQERERASTSTIERFLRAGIAAYHKYLVCTSVPIWHMSIMELLIITSYAACMFGILFGDAPDLNRPVYSPGWSNRAGIMVFASLPWVVLLAGKNSPIILLTGLPYERLNIFHRYAGRLTVVLALIHGGQKMSALGGARLSMPFLRWGVAGLSMTVALLCTSHRWSMRASYEIWYALHFLLAVGLLTSLWYHMPSQRNWLYATVALWCFERAARLFRIVMFNGLLRLRTSQTQPVHVEIISSNMLRVTVQKREFPAWTPGSHAYLHAPFMSSSTIWPQSHPFTIASIPASSQAAFHNTEESSASTLADHDSSTPNDESSGGSNANSIALKVLDSAEPPAFSLSNGQLTFFIRARTGWTLQLYKHVAAHGGLDKTLLLDGPYSAAPPITAAYDTVVFFAGGSGATWTTTMLLGLLEQAYREPSKVSVRRVVWIWSLRADEQALAQALIRNIPEPPSQIDLDIRLHMTGKLDGPIPLRIHAAPVTFARPYVEAALRDVIQDARGRVWVGASGPVGLIDAVRRAARRAVQPGKVLRGQLDGQITLHLEKFGW
ncbi:hypothetical protein IE81DRAFT_5623 [Ceraceosorus guamensis]|uniref:FAD-binding FR-type domain-containing protein n=1 Tax=Ceraceosorus guamensis TaxID=1522189 RepID=A0A316W910_9BASI|nr:hypothetical protein IE81DRAFT_5623 [Ceraceosorus guamensis]PWN46357.1 hypothetical protein IE81DRAFT_5623 [Ceraceosorus guamensis]